MTNRQIDKWAEKLAAQYGLSLQLTCAWLVEKKFKRRTPLSQMGIAALIEFAKT